jgi:hypothetical protein
MKRSYKEVLPDLIIATDQTVQPSRALIENMKINGIVEPLLAVPVYDKGDTLTGYNVLSGLRRFNAFEIARRELAEVAQMNPDMKAYQRYARQIETMKDKLSRVPIVIYEEATEEIVLIGNSLRAKNPLHELEAIESIQRRMLEGNLESDAPYTQRDIEREITRTTGMSAATQRNRLRLQNLNHDLRVLLACGRMSAAVADGAAKLPARLQKKLLEALAEKEETMGDRATITANDLREVQSINVRAASQSLFSNLDLSAPARE